MTITQLMNITREEILREFAADTCVLTVRVLHELLSMFGVESFPVTAKLIVLCPKITREVEKLKRLPTNEELSRIQTKVNGHSVGVGTHTPAGRTGHLVLMLNYRGNRILLDPSLDQASRPNKDIRMQPLTVTMGAAEEANTAYIQWINGCTVAYWFYPDRDDYSLTPDWCEPIRRDMVINRVMARILSSSFVALEGL